MSKELVIGSNRHETKVAILEEDQLVEIYFQRGNEYSLAGSIHKGRVTRVLPGMQSAFVDLGLERDTFLYVSDFFEEHEDIDTVDEKPARAEDKPSRVEERPVRIEEPRPVRADDRRGDRRDRDRDRSSGRGGDRPPQVRSLEPRESPVLAEPVLQAEPLMAEDELGVPAAELAATPKAADPRAAERNENRDFGGGDRKNRRSRRRRQHGRGFPDNKYAQSPGAVPAPALAEPVLSAEQEDEDTADVMVLPGESLAKYRRSAAPSQIQPQQKQTQIERPQQPLRSQAPIPEDEIPAPVPIDPEEQEAIEEEAESLELTEKIFSHHDDEESVEDVEEKIEEVKQDQPASSTSVNGEVAEAQGFTPADFTPTGFVPVREASFEAAREETRSSEFRPTLSKPPFGEVDAALSELPAAEPVDVHGVDVYESEALAMDEPISLAPEQRLGGEEGEPSQPDGAPQAQTATVREQGGRLMHRSSRRMRRRRGGSRFGQSPEGAAGAPGAIVVPAAAGVVMTAGAGVAMALEPETARREVLEERSAEKPERIMPSISDLLKSGQEIIVQIAKEPLGQKGARITSHIALPGRYVVFMPSVNHVGVSRKIASDEERLRLKRILQTHRAGTTGGFIVRTAGEGIPEEEIAADMSFLYSLWLDIRQKAEKKPAPALLHYDLDIVQRILRDQVTDEFKAIWVDNEDMYESILTFIQRFQPALVGRVKMYTRSAPIFDAFNITQELEKALRPKVWLKSGGYIVINQTEALVAIDINTGKYVGKSNRLEDTIVKTNTEAVKEIVRQIRLRDLGGIIVVDFIDMDERKNRQKVMQALEEAMRADKAPYKILQFNDFGLVAITRKRVKQSLEKTLCAPCPYCEGAGYVKSVQTVLGEILIEAQKIARAIEGKDVMLRANPEVAKVLKASDNHYLEELEEVLGRPVLVKGDPALHQEKFDLA